jgi:hypothetical protein
MQPRSVAYMGATIFPLIVRNLSGFSAAVVIADANQQRRGSGELGVFKTKLEAYRFAIAYGKSEIERQRLVTLAA